MSQDMDGTASQHQEPAANDDGKELSLDKHKQLLDEKKKMQADRDRMAAELEKYKAKEKAQADADMKKRGDFEAMLKQRDEEIESYKLKLKDIDDKITRNKKVNAVIAALGGNIDRKWVQIIDDEGVLLHPETGEIDPTSVAKVADALKKQWPEMVKSSGKVLPPDAPKGNKAGKITRAEWMEMSSKDMIKFRDQVID